MIKKIFLALIFALICGCSSGGSDNDALLRVFHASPDAPDLELLIDGEVERTGLGYLELFDYFGIDDGIRNLVLKEANGFTVLFDADIFFDQDIDYTLIVTDFEEEAEGIFLEDFNVAPDSGRVRIRVVHAAPSAGAVDVFVTAPEDDITFGGPTVPDASFGDATGFSESDAGLYQVRVTAQNDPTVIGVASDPFELQEGDVRTIVIVDAPGGGAPFGVVLLEDR